MKKFLATGKGKIIAGLGALVLLCVVCFCVFLLYTQTPAVQANLHATATAESIALAGTTAKRVTPTLTKTVPLILTQTTTPSALQTITPLASDLSIPPRRKYNHTYVIETTYDRFKDETTVGLKYKDPELNQRNGHIAISGSYAYQTQQPNPPSFIYLTLQTTIQKTTYLNGDTIYFIFDGTRRVQYDLLVLRFAALGNQEAVVLLLSQDDFLAIVNAQQIECRVGDTELTWTDEQREALRDFASRMGP